MKAFNWIKWVVIAMFIVTAVVIVTETVSLKMNGCEQTGLQRLANGVDGVYIENQYKCNNGKIKWSY